MGQGRGQKTAFNSKCGRLYAEAARALLAIVLWTGAAQAQTPPAEPLPLESAAPARKAIAKPRVTRPAVQPARNSLAEQINANTVSIISGNITGSYLRYAADIASVLDDGDKLRILPVMGKGAVQNVTDIVYLKGIDLGLVRTDSLEAIRREGKIRDVEKQVVYIARLAPDEMHIIARNEITDIRQLAGKKVNFDVVGSGTYFTTGLIFEKLGIPVTSTAHEQAVAYEKLRAGEIDASVFFGGKPVAGFVNFKNDGRFHMVSVPYDQRLSQFYLPAQMTSAEYPNLIPAGGAVETIAASTVLAAFNLTPGSERYNKVARFVDAFFTRFDEFQKAPRHPKWQEVNLAAVVPGWTRFKAAQDWLDRSSAGKAPDQYADFKKFVDSQKRSSGAGSAGADQERLFKEFLEWNRTRTKQ